MRGLDPRDVVVQTDCALSLNEPGFSAHTFRELLESDLVTAAVSRAVSTSRRYGTQALPKPGVSAQRRQAGDFAARRLC